MAKQKNNKSKQASNSNRIKTNVLRSSIIILLTVAASFLYLAFVATPQNNHKNIQALSNQLADSQVFLINQTVKQIQQQAQKLAQNPQLIEALEKQDQARLITLQIELQRSFPKALSAKLIPLGQLGIAGLNKEQAALRNNIELDMLRRVSNDDLEVIESYRNNKLALFSIAEAINVQTKTH